MHFLLQVIVFIANWVLWREILRLNSGCRCVLGIHSCEEKGQKQDWTESSWDAIHVREILGQRDRVLCLEQALLIQIVACGMKTAELLQLCLSQVTEAVPSGTKELLSKVTPQLCSPWAVRGGTSGGEGQLSPSLVGYLGSKTLCLKHQSNCSSV
jgi:hypothetical protein